MKFSVSQSSLEQALSIVGKGMASNSTLPILSGIYLKVRQGTLTLEATDLTISIRHETPANVEEEGEVVVSGKILATFRDEGSLLTITCEKSTFRLNTLESSDFPEFPQYSLERSIELPSDLLTRMVDKVYRVTSRDSSRPVLGGVLLSVVDNTIRLVATDSYRLAICDSNTETSTSEEEFVTLVAGTTLHEVLTMPSLEGRILIGTTQSQVVFSFGTTTYVARRIEGTFPNYKQLLPSSCNTSVTIDVEGFSAALKRVSVIALANPSVRFDIDADGKVMKLSASSPDQGESTELLPVEVTGESVAIALNYHYVFDCVNAASNERQITLELQSTMQPGIFKSYGRINYLYLLMPVRM